METESRSEPSGWFAATHWAVVLGAGSEDTSKSAVALASLCETYWAPVHSYIRRTGQREADAEDLTQQFFERFLAKEQYRLARRERGRFRSFLLTTVRHFLINEWERASAQKRGGGLIAESLDELVPEGDRARVEPLDERNAERIFEQAWALAVLERVRGRLEAEYETEGKAQRFALLEAFLPGEETELTYAQAAVRLGIAEGTVKSDMHRLKRRYRDLLREEIANTVASATEVDDELKHLMTVLSQPRG
jgi:RNA polymerase sigma factor (sigma-70 family)